ncbi:MAG: hypothetical protein ACJAYB_000098 [Psychromonas sp.]|jgi:hypothetical protein
MNNTDTSKIINDVLNLKFNEQFAGYRRTFGGWIYDSVNGSSQPIFIADQRAKGHWPELKVENKANDTDIKVLAEKLIEAIDSRPQDIYRLLSKVPNEIEKIVTVCKFIAHHFMELNTTDSYKWVVFHTGVVHPFMIAMDELSAKELHGVTCNIWPDPKEAKANKVRGGQWSNC